jgi:rare lipoprotein A
MISNRLAPALVSALVLSVSLAVPAHAASPVSGGVTAPGQTTATGLSLDAGAAFVGRLARFTGTVPESTAGSAVQIQRLTGADQWTTIASTTSDADGTYTATWQTQRAGAFTVRAVVGGAAQASSSDDLPSGDGVDRLLVYRSAISTWYGSALYGKKTACGETLSATLVGVANKTLPCGTRVAFYYKGRRVVAPVVDRGPYAGNRSFDLTYAAAKTLGMLSDGVGRVGWLSLGR